MKGRSNATHNKFGSLQQFQRNQKIKEKQNPQNPKNGNLDQKNTINGNQNQTHKKTAQNLQKKISQNKSEKIDQKTTQETQGQEIGETEQVILNPKKGNSERPLIPQNTTENGPSDSPRENLENQIPDHVPRSPKKKIVTDSLEENGGEDKNKNKPQNYPEIHLGKMNGQNSEKMNFGKPQNISPRENLGGGFPKKNLGELPREKIVVNSGIENATKNVLQPKDQTNQMTQQIGLLTTSLSQALDVIRALEKKLTETNISLQQTQLLCNQLFQTQHIQNTQIQNLTQQQKFLEQFLLNQNISYSQFLDQRNLNLAENQNLSEPQNLREENQNPIQSEEITVPDNF